MEVSYIDRVAMFYIKGIFIEHGLCKIPPAIHFGV
jgi:hypothetical protein